MHKCEKPVPKLLRTFESCLSTVAPGHLAICPRRFVTSQKCIVIATKKKIRYKGVLEHGTYLGYHSQPLVHIIRNIHIRVHSTHLVTFIFLNLDFLLSDGSGRVIIIVVVVRCRSVSCSRDRLETAKCVVRNPCQLKFTNVRNTEGLIQKILSLISFFES